MNDKFLSMLGFAKRAGKVVYGYDTLKTAKRIKLYAVSDTAADNLTDGMKKLAARAKAPLIRVARLEEKAGGNTKALGIRDRNMAQAIVDFVRAGADGYTNLPVDGGQFFD